MDNNVSACPNWCTINHQYFGPHHVNNVGQAIESGDTSLETNIVEDDGHPVILVNYGSPADRNRHVFPPETAVAIAHIVGLCTLTELRQFGHDLSRAAAIVRGAE